MVVFDIVPRSEADCVDLRWSFGGVFARRRQIAGRDGSEQLGKLSSTWETTVKTSNYWLDMGDERLWHGDQPVPISNKAFQLLRLFVDNPNRLLTKDDILDGVWRDVCVSKGLVKDYVHDLRLALGDDPKRPAYIETVHGRGYRFLGGVEAVGRPVDLEI